MLVCYCCCEHCQKTWVLHCRCCKITLWNLTWMWIFPLCHFICLSFWKTFLQRSLPRITWRMFSYFDCWNRLPPKTKRTGSWSFSKTIDLPEKQTALYCISHLLIFWWPGCVLGGRWMLAACWVPWTEVLEPKLLGLETEGRAMGHVWPPEQRGGRAKQTLLATRTGWWRICFKSQLGKQQ